jgi:tight adherence protein B
MNASAWSVALILSAFVLAAGRVRAHVVPSRQLIGRVPRNRTPWWSNRRSERSRARDEDVAEWCDHIARSVRAGTSISQAVVRAGVEAPDGGAPFAPAVMALTRGRALPDALDEITGAGDPASAVGLVVPVLGACAELGGPAAMPLERVAATLQARAAERAERRAHSAQAQLSARVLSTLPIGVLLLLAVAEPAVRSILVAPAGMVCLAVGGAFNVAGWWWMHRLIGGAA